MTKAVVGLLAGVGRNTTCVAAVVVVVVVVVVILAVVTAVVVVNVHCCDCCCCCYRVCCGGFRLVFLVGVWPLSYLASVARALLEDGVWLRMLGF